MQDIPPSLPALTPDELALQQLTEALNLRWNQGDARRYSELFTGDADYIAVEGSHYLGREAIERVHQALFNTRFRGSTLSGHLTHQRFLTPAVALLHRIGSVRLAEESQDDPADQSVQTLVAIKRGDRWLFSAFQNTEIQHYG